MALNPERESAHLQEIQMFDRRGEGLSTRSVLADKNSYKILVVEDALSAQHLICKLIYFALEELNIRRGVVLATASGEDALQLLEQNSIDLLIVDHHLPGITGLELIYSLKIKSTIPKITAAILISSDYDILNRVSQRYEIDGILRKPIARSALKEVLELVFASKPRIPYFKRREHR